MTMIRAMFALMSTLAFAGRDHDRTDPVERKDLRRASEDEYEQMRTEPRQALVIGMGSYEHTSPIPGTQEDVRLIAKALEEAGFQVKTVRNAGKEELDDALNAFLERADEGGVSLIYWSGHGLQWNGQGWLVPVDAELSDPARLNREAVSVEWVQAQLAASHTRLSVLMLDACRNDPWTKSWAKGTKSNPSVGLPLPAVVYGPQVVAYATAPGSTAADGGASAGPYARALARQIKEPGELRKTLGAVQIDVQQDTGGQQIPWVNAAPGEELFFFVMPTREEYELRYSQRAFGTLVVSTQRDGELSVDGELRARLSAGSSVPLSLAEDAHEVCLGNRCRQVAVQGAQTTEIQFESAPTLDERAPNLQQGMRVWAGLAGAAAAGVGVSAWQERQLWLDCTGRDLEACTAAGADPDSARRDNQVAVATAAGLGVVGAGLLTITFMW